MDLVSRLRQFLTANNIPVTQFADKCNIPRPTLSQIVNGRNKKISDEIISKIHEGYPDLSVYWLMFGEGNMMNPVSSTDSLNEDPTTSSQESAIIDRKPGQKLIFNSPEVINTHNPGYNSKNKPVQSKMVNAGQIVKGDENAYKERYITKIVVFYNDNSFESFAPNQNELL